MNATTASESSTPAPSPAAGTSRLPGPGSARTPAAGPRLGVGTVLVPRADDRLQVGLAPDRALEVGCGPDLSAADLASILAELDGRDTWEAVAARLELPPPTTRAVERILDRLWRFGHLTWPRPPAREETAPLTTPDVTAVDDDLLPAVRRVLVIGGGQIAQALRGPLSVNGCRVRLARVRGLELDRDAPPWNRTRPSRPMAAVEKSDDLVILADHVVPDPVVTEALVATGQPHLHIYARDDRIVVGPLVLPGRTCCLGCLHRYRSDRDPEWGRIAARLLGVSATAPVPALTAGISLVLSEILASRESGRAPEATAPLQTPGATVEISPAEGLWRRRPWPADPRCSCGAASERGPSDI